MVGGFDREKGETLVVGVGGGKGMIYWLFMRLLGEEKGGGEERLVLQDLPGVLEGIPEGELPQAMVKMAHDFFMEQPVKGTSRAFAVSFYVCCGTDKTDRCTYLLPASHPPRLAG